VISSIKIKSIASYNPTNGVDILNLKKVNFFFGFNGTGKSTIAKYLRNLSLNANEGNLQFEECSCIGYNSEISSEELKIRSLEERKRQYSDRLSRFRAIKDQDENQLLNICWNERNAFSAFTKFRLMQILETPLDSIKYFTPLKSDYDILYEKEIEEVTTTINVRLYTDLRRNENGLIKILDEVIVGNQDVDIADLIESLDSRNWVEQGQNYIQNGVDTCPFCQEQTITEQLLSKFEILFDESYREKKSKIKSLRDNYIRKANLFKDNLISIQNQFNPNNIVSNVILSFNEQIENNLRIINEKIGAPNERKSISSISEYIQDLKQIIHKIDENNKLDEEADEKKKLLEKEIWEYISRKCELSILEANKKKEKLDRLITIADQRIENFENLIQSSKQTIEALRGQTINTRDAVDKINTILKNCGFEGFEIEEKERRNNISRYFLKRPNSTENRFIFNTLSEGEKNFISFLYFYQLCLGTDDITSNSAKKRIIVIDDPVSSLDSQSLFIVSTLIHNLIQRKSNNNRSDKKKFKNEQISQVFILTHNIYFYKEVSFNRRQICTDYWHYKITKCDNSTSIVGDYNNTIKDDYSLMWSNLKELKTNLPTDSSSNIMISNIMRRVIESYVNFIGYGSDSWSSLNEDDLNDSNFYVKNAFISTINDESHKVHVMDSTYYQKIIHEQPQILFDVFGSIFKTIGKTHYELQMDEELT